MCWTGLTNYGRNEQVAKENIPTTKLVIIWPYDSIRSYYYDFEYKLNIDYRLNEPLKFEVRSGKYDTITKGFHSYSSKIKIRTYKNPLIVTAEYNTITLDQLDITTINYHIKGSIAIADCIIPKGAHYFLNHHGEYVSNTIKILNVYKIK